MKLALGTAQFGYHYGITNKIGTVNLEEITEILRFAQCNDIGTIDTAAAYGEAEKSLGNTGTDLTKFQVITKIPSGASFKEIREKFFQSLSHLKINKVHGLLIHNVNDILDDETGEIWRMLEQLKEEGYLDKIGVSIYSEEEIRKILQRYKVDIIQLPINIFDQRLLKSGILQEVKNSGVEIHARSLFLQGILLEEIKNLPIYFSQFEDTILKWHNFLKDKDLTPLEGALAFANSIDIIDYAVIGVTSLNNLTEIKTAFDKVKFLPNLQYEQFAVNNEKLINPNLWK